MGPGDVDLQAGVRRVRPRHRPPQVLLALIGQISRTALKKRPISAGNSVNDDAFCPEFLSFYLFISIISMLLSFHLTIPHVRMYTYKNTYKYEYVVRLMCFSFLTI